MLSPDTITPDLGMGLALLLVLAIAAFTAHDRHLDRQEAERADSHLDALDDRGQYIAGPCLSHNLTCAHPEPHPHGEACDRECVCQRTAA